MKLTLDILELMVKRKKKVLGVCKGGFFRNLVVGDHSVFYYIKWEFIKKSLGNPVIGGVATKKSSNLVRLLLMADFSA